MKSIIIRGASGSGKSETIKEVCKLLNPKIVYKLKPYKTDYKKSNLEVVNVESIFNNIYILHLERKIILVCAGAPTEQNLQISEVINICTKLNINISICLVAMRVFEKKIGFNTRNELKEVSEVIYNKRIYKIKNSNYKDTNEFILRTNNIKSLILKNL